MAYWLLKTEPDAFSIDDLKNAPEQTSMWDGVRNYQARNFLRDNIKHPGHVLKGAPPSLAMVRLFGLEGVPNV